MFCWGCYHQYPQFSYKNRKDEFCFVQNDEFVKKAGETQENRWKKQFFTWSLFSLNIECLSTVNRKRRLKQLKIATLGAANLWRELRLYVARSKDLATGDTFRLLQLGSQKCDSIFLWGRINLVLFYDETPGKVATCSSRNRREIWL